MATIRERPTGAGEQRFVVQFRAGGRGSRQRTLTFTRRRDAEKARDLINAVGPDEALQRLLGHAPAPAEVPTVAEWLERGTSPTSLA